MIGKRAGKSYVKKFVVVETKEEFDRIGFTQQDPAQFEKKDADKCEEEIIVPKFQIINKPPTPKNKIPIQEAYIKAIPSWRQKNGEKYELDSTDICFLQNKCPGLAENIFAEMLVNLQKAASRLGTQLNYQKILSRKLSQSGQAMGLQKQQQMLRDIYNFWRNKRKNFKSPLLRLFWTKNQMGPFKQRQYCNTLCLRNRTIKVQMDVIKSYLLNDLLQLKQIFVLMKTREKQEMKLIRLQLSTFENKIKRVLSKVKVALRSQQAKVKNQHIPCQNTGKKMQTRSRTSKRNLESEQQKSEHKNKVEEDEYVYIKD